MSVLYNTRRELFAQGIVSGLTQDAAYTAAGYKPNRHNASLLAKNPEVMARVEELKSVAAEKAGLTRAWVLDRLMRNARIAMCEEKITLTIKVRGEDEPKTVEVTDRDASGANKALELLGKEIGMFIERRENTNTNYNISDTPLTEDEWEREYSLGTTAGATNRLN